MTSTNLEELLILANPVVDPEELRLPTDDVDARCAAILKDRRVTIQKRSGVMPTATPTRKRPDVHPPTKRIRPALVFGLGLLAIVVAIGGIVIVMNGDEGDVADQPIAPAILDFSAIEGTWIGLLTFAEDQRTAWVELTLTSGATENSEIGTVLYRPSEESTQVTCDGFLLAGAATHPTYETFEGYDPGDRCYQGTLQLEYDPQAGTLSYDQRDIQSTATGTLTPSN